VRETPPDSSEDTPLATAPAVAFRTAGTARAISSATPSGGHRPNTDRGDVDGAVQRRSGDQLAAQGRTARVGLLDDVARLREEWQRVQGTSVDDPQRAVREASVLVDRILDKIRVNVGSTHPSETMPTEELRVNFQRYRESFQRLLSA
jgi:hypothetical protein